MFQASRNVSSAHSAVTSLTASNYLLRDRAEFLLTKQNKKKTSCQLYFFPLLGQDSLDVLYCSYLNQNRLQPSYYQYSLAWVISAQTPFLLSHHKQPKGPGEKKKKKVHTVFYFLLDVQFSVNCQSAVFHYHSCHSLGAVR